MMDGKFRMLPLIIFFEVPQPIVNGDMKISMPPSESTTHFEQL